MKDYKKIDGYSLSQVTSETGIHKDDLFRMAARGKIGLWIWSDNRLWIYDGTVSVPGEERGWFMIEDEIAGDFIDDDFIKVGSFITWQGKKVVPVDPADDGKDVVVPLDMPPKYGGDCGSRHRYFGDEPVSDEPRYVVANIEISREWLRILPHDMEKLRQQKGAVEQPNQPTKKIDPPKKYNRKALNNNLLIMAVMLKILTKNEGFDWYKTQGDLATTIAGWCDVPENSIEKRLGQARKTHLNPNHSPKYAHDRILDEYIIGVFLSLLLKPSEKKNSYSQKDLIEEVNNDENNKFERDEIQKRIKTAAAEKEKLKRIFHIK